MMPSDELDEVMAELRREHLRMEPPRCLETRLRVAVGRSSRASRSARLWHWAIAASLVAGILIWRTQFVQPASTEFIALPGSETLPAPLQTSILRVGLTSSARIVHADFIVGDDGLARAARPLAITAVMQGQTSPPRLETVRTLAAQTNVVKDKPYAAEAVTETVRVTVSGNRIVGRNLTRLYRDRSGRTRRDQVIETLGPSMPVTPSRMVFILDPVARFYYDLNPDERTGHELSLDALTPPRKFPIAPFSGKGAVLFRIRTVPLGKRAIGGLECIGTRGEAQEIVTETWWSDYLESVVESKTVNSRLDETTYTLRHIQLTDQPARLFVPPPSYHLER